MDTLKALLRGEYIEWLHVPTEDEEYLKLSRKFNEAEKALLEAMEPEMRNAYYKCITSLLSRESVCAEAIFEKGFTLGARMMCEILNGGK